ncbi:MAG: peptidoglycan DD-metalloendopeptidase family protein [Deltaproteobacteria bacterium]|nr:MAG: peptidoglycan DD-metalloendopeptidase family protein [Deltaproteobacteria bacterium]
MRQLITILLLIFFSSSASDQIEIGVKTKTIEQELIKSKQKLQELQRKIEQKGEAMEEVKLQEASVLSKLDQIERELSQKDKELRRIQRNLKTVDENIDNITLRIDQLRSRLKQQRKTVQSRTTAMYKLNRGGLIQILFAADSFSDLSRRYKFTRILIQYDREVLTDYLGNLQQLDQEQNALKKKEQELNGLETALKEKISQVDEQRTNKTILLSRIRKKKELHLEALQELEEASRELTHLIVNLETGGDKSIGAQGINFTQRKGTLDFPTEGKIVGVFGKRKNPRFNTVTFHKGIDIEAPEGTEIKAIYPGKVLYSDWFKGYGKIIIIDHGNSYYTLYAHAFRLLKAVGDEVREGETLALVGDTGSLEGPRLYFEIRQQGKPLDPLKWLRKKN